MGGWESRPEVRQTRRRLMERLRREIGDERVLRAMERVPRTAFVPPASRHMAYEDVPLAIGHGQTVSQPYIVAVMTAALVLRPSDKVLEVGTGSGFQAAVLAELAGRVVTVERIPPLAERRPLRAARPWATTTASQYILAGDALSAGPTTPPTTRFSCRRERPRSPAGCCDSLRREDAWSSPLAPGRSRTSCASTARATGFSFRRLGPCRFVPLIGSGAWASTPAGLARSWDCPERPCYTRQL